MAAWSPSFGIGSFCPSNGINRTWKFPSARICTGKNKIVTRKRFLEGFGARALQRYELSKACASKTSIELKEQVSTRRPQVDDSKKIDARILRAVAIEYPKDANECCCSFRDCSFVYLRFVP